MQAPVAPDASELRGRTGERAKPGSPVGREGRTQARACGLGSRAKARPGLDVRRLIKGTKQDRQASSTVPTYR